MLQMWKGGAQEVGMSKDEREKEEETEKTDVEGDEGTLWSKGTISKRSSNEYGKMDDVEGGGNFCKV